MKVEAKMSLRLTAGSHQYFYRHVGLFANRMIPYTVYHGLLHRLQTSLSILPDKPEETPTSCLMALWHKATRVEMSAASASSRPLGVLNPASESELRRLIDVRLSGEPLAYLTG